MPDFGFGNRVLYYNNLRQESHTTNKDWTCAPWEGHQYFKGDMLNSSDTTGTDLPLCLGERFFRCNSIPTRSIFKLKNKPDISSNTCAVHFRGTDFHRWNPESILSTDYYLNSIDAIKDNIVQFILFTDDNNLNSFNAVKSKLTKENIDFIYGDNTSNRNLFISDFSLMSECDYIISSPSTFCICAGFIGKEKRIIHSKDWVDSRVSKGDEFWVDLNNGGSEDYSLWRLI